MSNFIKGIVLTVLGVCIGLLSLLVPGAMGVFITLGGVLVVLGINNLIFD